jgi:hypothetical protein
MNEWIPVSEKLPDIDEEVLVELKQLNNIILI